MTDLKLLQIYTMMWLTLLEIRSRYFAFAQYDISFRHFEGVQRTTEESLHIESIKDSHSKHSEESKSLESKNQNMRFPIHSKFLESKSTQAHTTQLQWRECEIGDLFSVKSNPQLIKITLLEIMHKS